MDRHRADAAEAGKEGTAARGRPSVGVRCGPVYPVHGMPVARVTLWISTVFHRPEPFSRMAAERAPGAYRASSPGPRAAVSGALRGAGRRPGRQPVGEDHGERRPRGHHAGRKVKGRKRHLIVDAGGTPVVMTVHTAGIQDRDGAPDVTGTVERPEDVKGFTVLHRRWAVERTFAWMGRCRRLSKDCGRLCGNPLASGVRHHAPPVRAGVRHERTLAARRFPPRRVARASTP